MTKRASRGGDAPLLAWGEALRIAETRRRRIRRAAAFGTGLALLCMTIVAPPVPRLVWNASASAPIGLYAVAPGAPLVTGDMVIAQLPARFRSLAATRHYLPANVPLVKRVSAVAGDQVCAIGAEIFLNGGWLADRRQLDGEGRPTPWWQGCLQLHDGQFLLLMPGKSASFDGRYFGITEAHDVLGKAHMLWRR